jgi:energy-coupling factor transporter ATP-binding protein EcfA2
MKTSTLESRQDVRLDDREAVEAVDFEDQELQIPRDGMADVGLNVSGFYYAGDVYNAQLVKKLQAGGYNFYASSGNKFVKEDWEVPTHYASVTSWGNGYDDLEPACPRYYTQVSENLIVVFNLDETHLEGLRRINVCAYSNVSTDVVQQWLKDYAEKHFQEIPEDEEPEEFEVPMGFYYFGPRGAVYNSRRIAVHPWEETKRNYVPAVQSKVEALMAKSSIKEEDGKLLLMHGAPGGGKTHLIRTLAWAWREWAQFEIIIDPESFLGSAAYMTEIVMDDYTDGKYRILVLEDSGEFIATHAKERTGQGMSRLLNLADGILGQGQPLGFCITTNEAIGDLEASVTRPGRCLAQIEIPEFNIQQASNWLGYNVDRPMMLAEMYSTKNHSLADPKGKAEFSSGQYL